MWWETVWLRPLYARWKAYWNSEPVFSFHYLLLNLNLAGLILDSMGSGSMHAYDKFSGNYFQGPAESRILYKQWWPLGNAVHCLCGNRTDGGILPSGRQSPVCGGDLQSKTH